MGKWQLTLTAVATLLAAMLFIWLGSSGTGYSTAAQAISTEHKNAEASYDNHAARAMDANRQFIERARAIEAGFKAAFLFHS
jgi:adenylate kinase family enzyme